MDAFQFVAKDPTFPPMPGLNAQNFANAYKKSVKGFRTHPYLWMDLRNTTLD